MGASVGITVGVDGESEYSRSLKNITAETKAFQSELKALQSSFDKNASTWDKTQMTAGVLTDEIGAQYKKLDALRDAQSKVAEGSTKYFEYADKINKATDALNQMERQLESLPNHIQAIGEDFEKWGGNIENAGKKVSKVGDALMPMSTAAIGGLTAAVKETSDFDTAMSEVKAIAVSTQESLGRISAEEGIKQFEDLRNKAREMGRETVFSATESANAMSYLARAGWDTNQIISGVDGVMALAAADGLDLATTASIVADGVTAFGKSADYASQFADILAMTSAQSNTNVEMLGDSFKYVAPTAASLGYSVEDVALALGLSANAGVKASQAGTGLRQALKNLISPTDTVAAAADQFGISLYNAEGDALPLMDVITELRETFGDLEIAILDENGELKEGEAIMSEYADSLPVSQQEKLQAIVDIFGTRAMPTMLSIINAGEEDFNNLSEAIYNAQGAAQTMADTRLDNIGGDFTLLKDEILDLAISFGDIMVPVLRNDVIPMLRDAIGWLGGLDDSTKEMVVKVGLFAAAVGPVLSTGGRIITGIGTITSGIGKFINMVGGFKIAPFITAFKNIGSVISGIVTAIGPVGVAITLAVGIAIAAGVALYKHWDEVKEWAGRLKETISEKFDGIKEKASETWTNVKEDASAAWDNIKQKFADSTFGQGVITGFESIKTAANTLKESIANSALANVLKADFENIKNAFVDAGGGIEGTVAATAEALKSKWMFGLDLLNEVTGGKLQNTKAAFDDGWAFIKESAGAVWDNVKESFSTGFTAIQETLSVGWENIKTAFSAGAQWLSETFGPLFDALGYLFETCVEAVGVIVQRQWEEFSAEISAEWEIMKAEAQVVWDGIKTVITNVWTSISDFMGPVLNTIGTAIATKFDETLTKIDTNVGKIRTVVETGFASLAGRVAGPLSNFRNAITNAFNNVKSIVQGFVNLAKSWGRDLVGNIAAGIREKISSVTSAVRGVANSIRANLHFSEPDEGPLSDFHTYMPDMMKEIAGGIYKNMWMVDRAVESLAGALLPDINTGEISGKANTTTIKNGDINLTVYGAEGQDVRELARIVEQEITFNMNRRSAAFA